MACWFVGALSSKLCS